MTRRAPLPLIALLALALGGCGGEEKKTEPTAPTGPLVKLDIQGAIPRTITVERDGSVQDVLKGTPHAGKLAPDDLKAIADLGNKVEWPKLPTEFKTDKPVPDGRTYTLVWGGVKPARTVTSMDGATEDPAFAKLRDSIELHANKLMK